MIYSKVWTSFIHYSYECFCTIVILSSTIQRKAFQPTKRVVFNPNLLKLICCQTRSPGVMNELLLERFIPYFHIKGTSCRTRKVDIYGYILIALAQNRPPSRNLHLERLLTFVVLDSTLIRIGPLRRAGRKLPLGAPARVPDGH